jgi:hypothetical protein
LLRLADDSYQRDRDRREHAPCRSGKGFVSGARFSRKSTRRRSRRPAHLSVAKPKPAPAPADALRVLPRVRQLS